MLPDGIHTEPVEYHLEEERGRVVLSRIASSSSCTNPRFGTSCRYTIGSLGLPKGRQDIVDFQRPDGISGPLPPLFQITRLIQITKIDIRGKFFHFSDRVQICSRGLSRNSLFFDGFITVSFRSILGDSGAASRDDRMFVVKVYCKIETCLDCHAVKKGLLGELHLAWAHQIWGEECALAR